MSSSEVRSKPVRTPLERLGRQLRTLARPLPLFAALAVWMHEYDTAPDAARRETDVARSLSLGLAKLGLSADPTQVMLLPDRTPRGASGPPAGDRVEQERLYAPKTNRPDCDRGD